MKSWKSKKSVCRSRRSGRFSFKGKCGAFKKQLVKALSHGTLFQVLLLSPLLFCGCGTPQRTTFNAESGTVLTVDSAMRAWGDYVARFHPPVEQELQVKAAYEKYQAAMAVAVDASRAWSTLGTNAPVLDPSFQSATADALTDLLTLLRQFNVIK